MKKLLIVALALSGLSAFAQSTKKVNYMLSEVPKTNVVMLGAPQIQASSFKIFQMDITSLKSQLEGISNRTNEQVGFKAQVELPYPDGSLHSFITVANNTMHAELALKFPEIKTFDATNREEGAFVKWDITPKGLHAMIMIPGESTIFIDPYINGNTDYYIVYRKKDFFTDKLMDCSFNSDVSTMQNKSIPTTGVVEAYGTCELRTYRLAVSATGEYTTFQGGTVALAQAAQVTTMNRVNGVYEKDMAITMEIIPNNDLIVYTNAGSDPFTNGTPGSMINENQTTVDNVIGNGNYDIGHVFGTNSGGLAGLGVVCNNSQKARGVTGSSAPTGDSFDIDYVAHEMGHQFGANHTQNNSCNRNNATAMEPGSASTIMGYAGICVPNVQNNSDDHFHGVSLSEISSEILSGGHTCEALSPLSNNPPLITMTNGNISVPANTPFALTATVTDPDNDPITYNWEQMDNAVSTQPPVATSTDGPNFRSISSLTSPTRYFPNLTDLSNGVSPTWEVLSSVTRTMNFRVTVRDNAPGAGGCNDFQDVTIDVDGNSGPFIVLYPSATGIVWAALSSETVTWDVANTDVAPVNCATVDILLSTDGGLTYPTILAAGVSNDGSELISVPNVGTTTARIMVINSNGTFFDISDNDFEITMATFDFTQDVTTPSVSICQPSDATYEVNIGSVGGYTDPVTLSTTGVPAGATASFSANPVTPAGTSILTISNTGAVTPGSYTITISGASTSGTKTTDVMLIISDANPTVVTQISPVNGATTVSMPTNFTWTTAPGVGVTYDIEIATDAGFTAIIDNATGLVSPSYTSSGLGASTTYYWRVRSVTGCGVSTWSTGFDFTTNGCSIYAATDTPVTISSSGTPTITSTINIAGSGTINDVNILNLIGTHTWINDLTVTLTSPASTTVTLWDGICGNENDFDVNFDDAAAPGALPCPPVGGGTYQPQTVLSAFNGESITGNWVLTITDGVNQDGGSLDGWELELCTDPVPCNDPTLPTLTETSNTVCEGDAVTITVSGGALNDATNWQWYEGTCGGTSAGSGASMTFNPTSTTTYFVRGEGGCVTPGACTSITIDVNPTYDLNESATICDGDTYIFPDGTTGTTPQTYTSSLNTVLTGCDSIIVTTLAVTTISNTSENASICSGNSYTFPDGTTGNVDQSYTSTLTSILTGCDSIIVTNLTVVSTFNTTENATICEGDTYTFPDGTTGTTAQAYTSTVQSSGGCDSVIVTTLAVTTVNVSVTEASPMLTANATPATYVWIDCDNNNQPINGETAQSFTPSAVVGNYAVVVTENGCSATSACYLIDQAGIESINGQTVSIYPNPVVNSLKVEWSGNVQTIELTDYKGRLLKRFDSKGINSIEIDMSSFSSGVYFVNILTDSDRRVFDIIKQ